MFGGEVLQFLKVYHVLHRVWLELLKGSCFSVLTLPFGVHQSLPVALVALPSQDVKSSLTAQDCLRP